MMKAPGRPLTDVREVIVHHSKTPDGRTLSAPAIRRYHVDRNGWDDIGYHYLVEQYGSTVEITVGRPEDRRGAHCRGYNQHSIGVCFVGDFDAVEPSDHMLEVAATRLLWPVMRRHGLTTSDLVGDRDRHPTKTCPGSKFDLDRLRAAVNAARRVRL